MNAARLDAGYFGISALFRFAQRAFGAGRSLVRDNALDQQKTPPPEPQIPQRNAEVVDEAWRARGVCGFVRRSDGVNER